MTLADGVHVITFAAAAGRIVAFAAAVADPEKTDAGSLIGLVRLFKLKGGLWSTFVVR